MSFTYKSIHAKEKKATFVRVSLLRILKKLLIIRFSSIGDIVLTTPVIRCLKQQLKDVEIHFLTKKSFEAILQNNPYITKIYTIEKEKFLDCFI